jgi:hypothetical protein
METDIDSLNQVELGHLHKNEDDLKTLIFIFLNPLSTSLYNIFISTQSN